MMDWVKKWIIVAGVILAAVIAIICVDNKIARLTAERDRNAGNTVALLSKIQHYRVRDSLNAARVQSLELTIKEFEQFRAADAALIKQLKARNRDLVAVNKTQSETIIELQAAPRDTFIVRDSIPIPAVAVHCGDAWFDFTGVLTQDNFTGTLHNRDSLIVAETVQYKRFLGFLWKTNKVKDRRVDVVSKNPHSTIVDVEHIFINH